MGRRQQRARASRRASSSPTSATSPPTRCCAATASRSSPSPGSSSAAAAAAHAACPARSCATRSRTGDGDHEHRHRPAGRHFLTLADFTPRRAHATCSTSPPSSRPPSAQRQRGAAPRGQADRADLREGLDPDALRVRGGGLRPGRPRTYLGPGGSHIGHKETVKDTARVLGRMYDAIEYRGFGEAVADELAALGRRARLQRPHRRVAPDADPRRLPDAARARRTSRSSEVVVLLPGRRALQHGRLLPRGRRQARDGPPHREPARALAARRRSSTLAQRDRRRDRRDDHHHRDVAERRRAAATRSPPTCGSRWASPSEVWAERIGLLLPYQVNASGARADRQPRRQVPALPAGVPQRRHEVGAEILDRFGHRRARGHRRGLRVARLDRLRRGREPDAHHQGRARRHARETDRCASSSPSAATRSSGAASR